MDEIQRCGKCGGLRKGGGEYADVSMARCHCPRGRRQEAALQDGLGLDTAEISEAETREFLARQGA